MNTVIVSEETKPINVFDEDFHHVQIGTVQSRIYEGENVVRHAFTTEDGHEVVLGATRTAFQNLDYAEILDPLLEMGFIITKFYLVRRGINLITYLEPGEDRALLKDPTSWDRGYWTDRYPNRKNLGGLREMISVTASLKPGRGFHFDYGLYRLICTNGMVAKILGFPTLHFNHANFNPEALRSMNGTDVPGLFSGKSHIEVGNKAGVQLFKNFMVNMEEAGPPPLPFYLREEISVLTRLPTWFSQALILSLELYLANGPSKFTLIDLMNAVTNPISMSPEHDGAAGRVVLKTNSIMKSSAMLIGAYSL